MKRIKKLLGFDSQYSWMKWLKMAFAVVALIIASAFWDNFGFIIMETGIIGIILGLLAFVFLFGPLLLIMLGVATLIGTLIGGTLSGVKQHKSFKETAAIGSAELMELEKLRMKSQMLDFLFIIAVIALIILFFPLGIPLMEAFGEPGLYGYIILAVILLSGFWAAKAPVKARYKDSFKENVVKKSLSSVLSNMEFLPEQKLDEALVKAAALFPRYDIYGGNDYLAADYHGHHFVQSDIHLQEEREESYTDDDDNVQMRTVYVTIFRGRLMIFDYDAISDEPVAVLDRCGGKPKSTEMIQTELDAFNQRFFVVAPSPTAALRILTPPVLESIVLARSKLDYPLYLSFREDKLYVALANGDSFEAAGGDVTLAEQRRRVAGDNQTMLGLIDTLYLKNEGGTRTSI